jgi:uncharacterized protein YndB with AHSA1/START domain
MKATKYALEVTTPSDLEIVMTRSFNAPRHLVWEAMTRPELIRRWLYAPEGWTMTVCEGDNWVGGTFRWAWNGPDGRPALAIWGVNKEVVPPEKIVHTESMAMGDGVLLGELLATVELAERDGETHLRMTLLFACKEARDGALASGMERGVAAGYDRLDEILASQA